MIFGDQSIDNSLLMSHAKFNGDWLYMHALLGRGNRHWEQLGTNLLGSVIITILLLFPIF